MLLQAIKKFINGILKILIWEDLFWILFLITCLLSIVLNGWQLKLKQKE